MPIAVDHLGFRKELTMTDKPMTDEVFAAELVRRLNRLIESDDRLPRVMSELTLGHGRVNVPNDLAEKHPTLQCCDKKQATVGFIGVLNGLMDPTRLDGTGSEVRVAGQFGDGCRKLNAFHILDSDDCARGDTDPGVSAG
jgi:hypothetical protein